MEQLLKHLQKQLLNNQPAILLSIVHAQGSAPRGTGAHMLADQNGILAGTIGGGALEYEVLSEVHRRLSGLDGKALFHFSLNMEEVKNLGMVCGGNVDILFTPFFPNPKTCHLIEHALEMFAQREVFWMAFPLDGSLPSLLTESPLPVSSPNSSIEEYDNQTCYIEKMLDAGRVFVFGGGHISKELVPLLSHLNFRCIVSDDRPEFASKELFPDAEEVRLISFWNLKDQFSISPEDDIIVLTRGHEWDTDVQRFALKTPARYIGVVGSRKKKAAVFESLKKDGFTQEDLSRIVTPIGMNIGAQTPAEIAVSIAAQLIAVRSGKSPYTDGRF